MYLVLVNQIVDQVFFTTDRHIFSQLWLCPVQPVIKSQESISESPGKQQSLFQLVLPWGEKAQFSAQRIYSNHYRSDGTAHIRLTSHWISRWWCPMNLWARTPCSPGAVCLLGPALSPGVSGHSSDKPHTWAASSGEVSGTPEDIQMHFINDPLWRIYFFWGETSSVVYTYYTIDYLFSLSSVFFLHHILWGTKCKIM